jgi:sugar/nucleoside kinase (ribokinase family)
VAVLLTIGDLVEDVVVELRGPVNIASDTGARITRRRGGSAANVAAVAARLSGEARFIGQVGDDAAGAWLIDQLAGDGVDVSFVCRRGATATIVVLVDAAGERTMLVDQGSARDLDDPEARWLDGAEVLHLTLYSLLDEPIATTSRELADLAHDRDVALSIDVSSAALIESAGPDAVLDLLRALQPAVVFANAHEASVLGLEGPIGASAVIVKNGPGPSRIYLPGSAPIDVASTPVRAPIDSTGAGDAFAAGVLTHPNWRHDLSAACRSGHRAAHDFLLERAPQG